MVQLKAKALFEYSCTLQQQQQEDHLPLRAGDVLIINQQEHDSGWWNGTRLSDGSTGWFPGSYVEVLSESATEQPKSATSGKSWQKPQQKSNNSLNVAQLGEMLQRGINVNSNPVSPTLQQHQQQQSANGEWEQYYTEDGEPYYVNSVTNESRWELPSASGSRKASLVKSPRTSFSQHHQPELPMLPPPPLPADSPSFDSNRPLSRPGSVSSWSIGTRPTVADGEQSPVQGAITDSTGRFGYEGNFWSDKGDKSGFDILVLKHRNGKEVCKDIAQFMAERARIEEIYAKSLMDLANGQLGDLESGTMKTAWNQLKFDVLSQGKQRLEFSKQLIKEVQTPIMNFKNEQKKTRKNYEATIAEDRRLMLVKYSNARKMKKVYKNRSADADMAEALVKRGQTDTMTKKDFIKIEEAAKKERKRANIAALDYKNAVEDYEKIRVQWEEDMQSACYEFQQAEENRLDFLKTRLDAYLEVQKAVNNDCKESSEMVSNSVISVSKEVDIEMFVKSNCTGTQRPPQLHFERFGNIDLP